MKVLVIDTALNACTAAVFEDARALAVRSEPMSKGHQERIGVLVRDVMSEAFPGAGGGFDSLDRIGVTVGPGSFTGLRVGLAFAQGLGAALGVPVIGMSTLEALAKSAETNGDVAVAVDARRGQVYLQTFRGGVAVSAAEGVLIEAARAHLEQAGDWRIIGSGTGLLDAASDITEPTPDALAALTVAADPETAPPKPLYLRAPDATPPTRLPGQPRPARA